MIFAVETYGSEALNHRVLSPEQYVYLLISAFSKTGNTILKFEGNGIKIARKINNLITTAP